MLSVPDMDDLLDSLESDVDSGGGGKTTGSQKKGASDQQTNQSRVLEHCKMVDSVLDRMDLENDGHDRSDHQSSSTGNRKPHTGRTAGKECDKQRDRPIDVENTSEAERVQLTASSARDQLIPTSLSSPSNMPESSVAFSEAELPPEQVVEKLADPGSSGKSEILPLSSSLPQLSERAPELSSEAADLPEETTASFEEKSESAEVANATKKLETAQFVKPDDPAPITNAVKKSAPVQISDGSVDDEIFVFPCERRLKRVSDNENRERSPASESPVIYVSAAEEKLQKHEPTAEGDFELHEACNDAPNIAEAAETPSSPPEIENTDAETSNERAELREDTSDLSAPGDELPTVDCFPEEALMSSESAAEILESSGNLETPEPNTDENPVGSEPTDRSDVHFSIEGSPMPVVTTEFDTATALGTSSTFDAEIEQELSQMSSGEASFIVRDIMEHPPPTPDDAVEQPPRPPSPEPSDDDREEQEEAENASAQPRPYSPGPSQPIDIPRESSYDARPSSVVLSTHDLGELNENPPLTESELQLGKAKPYWIPDDDCSHCMLCVSKFTVLNRRHHCRCCGRVLCSACCSIKRSLPYIEDPEKKQKVCEPCSNLLIRIEAHEAEAGVSFGAGVEQSRANADAEAHPTVGSATDGVLGDDEGTNEASLIAGRQSTRKKSVLKNRTTSEATGSGGPDSNRRSVKFLDGVRPGHANDESRPGPSASTAAAEAHPTQSSVADASSSGDEQPEASKKKPVKKVSSHRRNRERRVEEEQISLLNAYHVFAVDCDFGMTKLTLCDLTTRLLSGESLTIAVKRNYHVIVQLVDLQSTKIWCFSSCGLSAIGVDELVLVVEAAPSHLDPSGDKLPVIPVLELFDHFYHEALVPANESLDEKVGIRKCGARMTKLYLVPTGQVAGISAVAVLFHRLQGQSVDGLPIPTGVPFFIGTLILKEELGWAMAIPNRVLLRIGMLSECFPVNVVNVQNRAPVYTEVATHTVLKVFNDFKNWSYRLPKIMGSTAEVVDGCLIKVYIPKWSREGVNQIIESNRNMLAWATELTDHPDCYLVAVQHPETHSFRTELFSDVSGTRQTIGTSFVVFDGSLKNTVEKFTMDILEDGIILRFTLEKMEELIKCLQAGAAFTIDSSSLSVQILFVDPYEPKSPVGALLSPVDGMHLMGNYQYGLTLDRQLRSQIPIPGTTDWALRLAKVINIEPGRFPLPLQPRYFEVAEQVSLYIASSIEKVIRSLVISNMREICIRIRIENDSVSYDAEKWKPELEQEQYQWTTTLDDQLIPYLYQLCAHIPNLLHIELHLAVISIRLLQNVIDGADAAQ